MWPQRPVDHFDDVESDVTARPPGPFLVFVGDQMAQVGYAGSDRKEDTVHEASKDGQRSADDGVESDHYPAERQEGRADVFPQQVCFR